MAYVSNCRLCTHSKLLHFYIVGGILYDGYIAVKSMSKFKARVSLCADCVRKVNEAWKWRRLKRNPVCKCLTAWWQRLSQDNATTKLKIVRERVAEEPAPQTAGEHLVDVFTAAGFETIAGREPTPLLKPQLPAACRLCGNENRKHIIVDFSGTVDKMLGIADEGAICDVCASAIVTGERQRIKQWLYDQKHGIHRY